MSQEKPRRGTVLAVGPGKRNADGSLLLMHLVAGDKVLFPKYSGNLVELDGKEYLILNEQEVLGKFS